MERILGYLRDTELIDLYKKLTPHFPLSERHQQFLDGLPRLRLVSLVARSMGDIEDARGAESRRERALFWKRLNDPEEGKAIRRQVKEYYDRVIGPEQVVIGVCVEKNLEGKSLQEAAAIKGLPVEEAAIAITRVLEGFGHARDTDYSSIVIYNDNTYRRIFETIFLKEEADAG